MIRTSGLEDEEWFAIEDAAGNSKRDAFQFGSGDVVVGERGMRTTGEGELVAVRSYTVE